jgi:hypothetical protein
VSAPDVIIPEVVVEAHCPACCPSTTEDRGYRTTLQMPPWLAFAVRFCRMGDDGLAQHVRRVPDEYLSRGCPVLVRGGGACRPGSRGVLVPAVASG